MTTSNSLPPIAVDIVIFALAWFSDSEMNFSLVPGFSFSNSLESFWASVICELDTKAIVTSFADAPRLPAPAQPEVTTSPVAAAHNASFLSTFTFTSPLTEPTTNGHNQCRRPASWPTCHAVRQGLRGAWRHRWRSAWSS